MHNKNKYLISGDVDYLNTSFPHLYFISKKSCTSVQVEYTYLLYKIGQDFLDIQQCFSDGFNGDTLDGVDEVYWDQGIELGHPIGNFLSCTALYFNVVLKKLKFNSWVYDMYSHSIRQNYFSRFMRKIIKNIQYSFH